MTKPDAAVSGVENAVGAAERDMAPVFDGADNWLREFIADQRRGQRLRRNGGDDADCLDEIRARLIAAGGRQSEAANLEIHELKTALAKIAMYCDRFERSRPAEDVLHALTVTVPRMCLEALNVS